jgi:general secretion pathway protein I
MNTSHGRSNYRRGRVPRGFTLIEVLIALTIVALSAGALLGAVTSSASNVIYLKEKTLAEWVALNRLTEIRIAVDMPAEGRRKGNTTMAGMRWEWEEEVSELPLVQGLFRVDVRAHATGELVDDTRPVQQNAAQTVTPTTSSGSQANKVNWTTTVTGMVGASRSAIRSPIAAPLSGTPSNNPAQPPGGAPPPNPPKTTAPSS